MGMMGGVGFIYPARVARTIWRPRCIVADTKGGWFFFLGILRFCEETRNFARRDSFFRGNLHDRIETCMSGRISIGRRRDKLEYLLMA
jgi:hypothetical protein